MRQIRLEGVYITSDGLVDEVVIEQTDSAAGGVTFTCRSYSRRGKLKLSTVIVTRKEWERFVREISEPFE